MTYIRINLLMQAEPENDLFLCCCLILYLIKTLGKVCEYMPKTDGLVAYV